MSIKVRELTQKMKNQSLGLSANKATTLPNLQHLTELRHCTAAYQEHILFFKWQNKPACNSKQN